MKCSFGSHRKFVCILLYEEIASCREPVQTVHHTLTHHPAALHPAAAAAAAALVPQAAADTCLRCALACVKGVCQLHIPCKVLCFSSCSLLFRSCSFCYIHLWCLEGRSGNLAVQGTSTNGASYTDSSSSGASSGSGSGSGASSSSPRSSPSPSGSRSPSTSPSYGPSSGPSSSPSDKNSGSSSGMSSGSGSNSRSSAAQTGTGSGTSGRHLLQAAPAGYGANDRGMSKIASFCS